MIKSIKAILAQDKEKFKVPRKVQDLIPIKNIWPDGIFKVGNKFSKSFRFSDINYLVASREDKESMFLTYSELLNSLDSGATTKITINNHRLNRSDFEESILMPMKQDGLDEYRKEYNDMLLDKATGANGITQEKYIKGGIYFGENAISHNLIMCNKANLLNQSAFLLGVPGSGKSFSAKELITFLILNTNDDILICDPEGEYAPLIEAMGNLGSVIRVSAGGRDRLNAMYMVDGYGENNPIVVKSEFIMSLIEQIDKKGVGPQHKSIIDRCITNVYRNAADTGTIPTLCTLRDMLLEQPEPEAKQIALSLELYTTGSLDIFGKQSNVDLDKRVVVFDIHGLGSQLKPTGLLVITDTMLNRVTLNWKKGKRTHVFIDEFHVVFENEFSAQFFNSAWRQFRKRNAYPTAITQNVEYLLDSVQASTMLSNSEFVVMLNQAASDRGQLAKLLNISNEQMSYITNADAGCGLIKYGSALVPFINRFPQDTKLYQLMTTRPGEGKFARGRD